MTWKCLSCFRRSCTVGRSAGAVGVPHGGLPTSARLVTCARLSDFVQFTYVLVAYCSSQYFCYYLWLRKSVNIIFITFFLFRSFWPEPRTQNDKIIITFHDLIYCVYCWLYGIHIFMYAIWRYSCNVNCNIM